MVLDILIRDARVYDGTGSPWYRASIGIKRGRIAAIGVVKEQARQRINAESLAVCPGFVDVHTHADGIAECPTADNMLRQGVTTVISGNCGHSALPVKDILDRVESARPAINYATLVGHGAIRSRVMGAASREPTRREMARMRRVAEQAMRQGAAGMSTGLFYVPGAYAKVDELVELAKVVSAWGGVYASHKRSAGGKLFEALREAAVIGKRANIGIEISHLKILHKRGRTKRDRARQALAAISRHREDGVEMTYDLHPYPATYTHLAAVVIPAWVSKDGKLKERLKNSAIRRRIRREVGGKIGWIGGGDKFTIAEFLPDRSMEGKTLADVARSRQRDVVSTAMDLIVEGAPSCIFHALRPEDVATIICGENSMIASDGFIVPSRTGVVHPRNYGTFPRVLREYVREKRQMSFEQAIRKMTSLPARKFGIPERGILAVGMRADLVVFDPDTIAERATFDQPHRFPVGVKRVIVNGHIAWNGRAVSKRRSGVVIRRPLSHSESSHQRH